HLFAVDEDVAQLRVPGQQVAARDNEVSDLAHLDAAELVARAEYLRRVHRQRAQRFILRQAALDGALHVGDEVCGPQRARAESELDAGLRESRRALRRLDRKSTRLNS